MQKLMRFVFAAWLVLACALMARGAVFAPSDGYFGISLPYVPPPSALDLRVDGDALSPLLGRPTNGTFVARPTDPRLAAAADYLRQGSLVLAAMEMENLRRAAPPMIWSRMPLGDVYYDIGWYPQAIEFCEQALAFNPDLATVRRVHVEALIAAGRAKPACSAAASYAETRRDDPDARYLLARALFAAGHLNEALNAADAALLLDDHRAETWRLKAQLLLDAKRPRDAVEAALRCRRAQGGSVAVTLLLGRAFEDLNDSKQAGAFFREAAQGSQPPLEALMALAKFEEHSNPGEAIATLEKAEDAYPNVAAVRTFLAALYRAALRAPDAAREKSAAASLEGRADEALAAALESISGDPSRPVNYVNASALLQRRGELKGAESMAEQAHARFPDDAAAAIRLAQVKAARGNLDGAISLLEGTKPEVAQQQAVQFELARLFASASNYERAVQIAEVAMPAVPSPDAFRLAGDWRMALGQPQIARDIFARGLKISPLSADLLGGYAFAAMSCEGGAAADVLPLARKAAELAPDNAEVADTLGWALAESGHTAEAVHVLQDVVRKLPESQSAGYHLALALARDGRADESKKKLEEIIAKEKTFPERTAACELLEKINGAKR